MYEIAVLVAENLHFDVARAAHQFLQIDFVVAECGQRLAPRDVDLRSEVGLGFDHAHAAAATAPTRFQHQRITDFRRHLLGQLDIRRQGAGRRHHRHVGGNRGIARGNLVAERAHHIRTRTDEMDAGVRAGIGKFGILGKEAVARMDRVDFRLLGELDDAVDIEIRRDRLLAGPNRIAFVGLEAMQREAVFVGIDRHRADAHLGGRAHDTDRDFGAVGDENFSDAGHAWSSFMRGAAAL